MKIHCLEAGRVGLVTFVLGTMVATGGSIDLIPVADTGIISSAVNDNYGGATSLILGGIAQDGQRGRVLLRFDLRSIPADAVVTKASLKLTVLKANSSGVRAPLDLHRLLVNWGEGTKSSGGGVQDHGGLAEDGEATWLTPGSGAATWLAPGALAGGDYEVSASATGTLSTPGETIIDSSGPLMADVQEWVRHPGINRGWILINVLEDSAKTARRIGSRENVDGPPLLSVEYSLPDTTVPPLVSLSRTTDQLELTFPTKSGGNYVIETASGLGAAWQVLTHVSGVGGPMTVRSPITATSEFFRLSIR